jgi:hypothetical protein
MFFSSAAIVSGVAAADDDSGSSPTYIFDTLAAAVAVAADARSQREEILQEVHREVARREEQ